MTTTKKIPLGITMGCPVGVGPEIILRFFQHQEESSSPLVVLGDLGVLAQTAHHLGIDCQLVPWQSGQEIKAGTLPVIPVSHVPESDLIWGQPNLETAKAMVLYIERAVQMINEQQLAGMVTCPISKIALKQTGSPYPGHTEMLASLTGATEFRMMMAGDRLSVVLVTIHEPLERVSTLLSCKEILDCIAMTASSLQQDFGILSPRIAVAGLNPHAGEDGMFGSEEEKLIAPAIAKYNGQAQVSGPWPPDTVFHKAAGGDFDAVVAMYHDQGLIPFKLLHFSDGVNVTLGLPIVRTSVDHGTAYDIAGQGVADYASLEAAVALAARIVRNRKKGNVE